MLIGDFDTLRTVHDLHLAHLVILHCLHAQNAQQVVRVDRAFDQLRASLHMVAVVDLELGVVADGIFLGIAVVAGDHDFAALLVVLLQMHHARDFRQRRFTLGLSGFENFLYARQTLGDVLAGGHAAGVEGTHGELRAGLADGLRCDDAHRFAHIHQAAVGHVRAIAARAHAVLVLAGERGTHAHFLDARGFDLIRQVVRDQLVERNDHFPGVRVNDVFRGHAATDAVLHGFNHAAIVVYIAHGDAAHLFTGALKAIQLAHDDLLRHIHQAARHIAGVRRFQSGVCQRFARAMRRQEEFQHREAFTEVGADRQLDDLARRRSHQAAHTRQLPDLVHTTARAGGRHHVDGVKLFQ